MRPQAARPALSRMAEPRQTAALLAAARVLEADATDDLLDLRRMMRAGPVFVRAKVTRTTSLPRLLSGPQGTWSLPGLRSRLPFKAGQCRRSCSRRQAGPTAVVRLSAGWADHRGAAGRWVSCC